MAVDPKIISVDTDDDDGVDIKSFTIFMRENTERNKNTTANQFAELGEDLLTEIDEKKQRKELKKEKLIKYILKKDKGIYSERQLKSYSYEDVRDIYMELRDNKLFRRIFHFIFNLSNR